MGIIYVYKRKKIGSETIEIPDFKNKDHPTVGMVRGRLIHITVAGQPKNVFCFRVVTETSDGQRRLDYLLKFLTCKNVCSV